MPVTSVMLPETKKLILNSVYRSVVEDVAREVGIAPTDLIIVHTDMEISKTDNRSNASITSAVNLPSTIGERKITAVITENYDEEQLSTTATDRHDSVPIFLDGPLNISIHPVYVKSEITVNFQFTTASKTEARRIRDDIRIKLSEARNILHHSVDFNIMIPRLVETFIEDVHTLRSRLIPSSLEDYFLSYSTNRVHMVTDLAGNEGNNRIAVRERQGRIIGQFDFSPLPDSIESDASTNTHKLTIPYKFNFDVPRSLVIKYPPMICNRPLPAKYLQFVEDRRRVGTAEKAKDMQYSLSLGAMAHFESTRFIRKTMNRELPLALPMFDTFTTKEGHKGYAHLLSVLVSVDETDKKSLLNLREIDSEYTLSPKLLECIRTIDRAKVVNPYMSFFYIGLHQDDLRFDDNILEIDADLNVKSRFPLSLIKPTRVTLSVCIDVTAFDHSTMIRMYQHKDYVLLYLSALMEGLRDFKVEHSKLLSPEHSFYRFFVLLLSDAVARKEHDFIRAAIEVLSSNYQLITTLAAVLKNNFSRLYNKLCQYSDLEKFEVDPKHQSDFNRKAFYMMTTVMTTYVQLAEMQHP